jgi:UDP-N-acetyl-D-mannosaminuronate dehydrogenase
MEEQQSVVVAGLGEIGRPLLRILSRTFNAFGVDIEPVTVTAANPVLHVCYPYQIAGFEQITVDYIHTLRPVLTIIHSTVPPGTTLRIQELIGDTDIAFSPVRGKHARMELHMLQYQKFVAAPRPSARLAALEHLSHAGFRTASLSSSELLELAKLLETTYLGVLIAWTQEMERLAAHYGGTFTEVNRLMEEVDYLPANIFPGAIGGHCVLPNIDLLRSCVASPFLDLVVHSNELKTQLPQAARTEEAHHENCTDRIGVLGS